MEQLQRIDGVAYVRFASVYSRFDDVARMAEEIDRLQALIHRQEELKNQMELPLQTPEDVS
jgi:transcriptional regulator NrdR family protein